ncbi:class I SAM-dependent methyltransferase [Acidovorax sp. D2M1]|uniref:Class I SAM-dependent methyltransferase n=1 Tax=Acidovorax benzenivorans TaxID=2987520 RepID=A0ABT5RX72_9BURK|nr:class I SAM-dependent methyltransferase [Acidovorax benzenivorans]MDD2177682.1 class I SAM-dependent methyltransferase [Acidovorax benzenivorans]
MPIFLHVGCGQNTKVRTTRALNTPEWTELRLDIDPAVAPDIVGSMTDMRAVADGSVDAIYSSHNIEHLYPHEVPAALAEFLRVLKPEGFAIITCPDLQAVADLVAQDKLMQPAYQSPAGPITPLDILYGHRPALALGNLYMAHRTGFTLNSLMQTFKAAGFSACAGKRQPPPAYALWLLAAKQPVAETTLRQLAAVHFPS